MTNPRRTSLRRTRLLPTSRQLIHLQLPRRRRTHLLLTSSQPIHPQLLNRRPTSLPPLWRQAISPERVKLRRASRRPRRRRQRRSRLRRNHPLRSHLDRRRPRRRRCTAIGAITIITIITGVITGDTMRLARPEASRRAAPGLNQAKPESSLPIISRPRPVKTSLCRGRGSDAPVASW
jgi:hypothetical protein